MNRRIGSNLKRLHFQTFKLFADYKSTLLCSSTHLKPWME